MNEKGSRITLFENDTTGLQKNETFTINDQDILNLINTDKYYLKIYIGTNVSYSSSNDVVVIGSLNTHIPIILKRDDPIYGIIRLSKSGSTVTFQTFTGISGCYLHGVYLVKV